MVIHHGDCLEVMKGMRSKSIDLVVTSPPYNIAGDSPRTHFGASDKALGGYIEHEDNMPHDDYVKWQRRCLDEMMRLLKPTGAIFYNHKWQTKDKLLLDRSDIVDGFPVRQIIIWWRKCGLSFAETRFLPSYEVIYLIAKEDFRLLPSKKGIMDVWQFTPEKNNMHPAPFPVEIPLRCISSCLDRNDQVVLDPFLGSGTTAVAAERAGIHWEGVEKSQEYIEMAQARIDLERRQMRLSL